MHIWSRVRGNINLQRDQHGIGPRPEREFSIEGLR
jgi:hypothetical protein